MPTLDPKELIKKVRRIQIQTRNTVNDLFSGQYHSTFKGRGMEFEEVREYMPGDDIRTIDWNVTARSGRPYIKKFAEERELTVMLLIDVSASNLFGSQSQLKQDLATEIAAVLAFSAIRNNDRIGLILFSDQVEKVLPAQKGTQHVLRIIRECSPSNPPEKIATCPPRSTISIISVPDALPHFYSVISISMTPPNRSSKQRPADTTSSPFKSAIAVKPRFPPPD